MRFKEMKITSKLFFITISILVSFLFITFMIQRIFFEKTYLNTKDKEMRQNIISFGNEFYQLKNIYSLSDVYKDYQDSKNITLYIVDTNTGNPLNLFDAGYIQMENAKVYYNTIQNESHLLDDISKLNYGSKIYETNVEGTPKILLGAYKAKTSKYMIIGVTSLQPIDEAIGVVVSFYKVFIFIALVLIIIIVFAYVKIITRPLKQLNNIAVSMAELDFTMRYKVVSKDEIGSLGNSLNKLAHNLYTALTSLQNANDKLKEDIAKEKQLETIRKDFIASASHELKTPITLIQGYVEGVKDGIFQGEEVNNCLDIILDESKKMNKLVQDMLEISKLENEEMKLELSQFNIKELILEEINKFSNIIEEKQLKIEVTGEESALYADRFRINQVITNLLSNEIRYAKSNIWVNIDSIKDDIYVSIENDGPQISNEDLELIWDKFYKIDKSGNKDISGTGLGLSIVKRIVETHGGHGGVRNTEKGVLFDFTIPKNIDKIELD